MLPLGKLLVETPEDLDDAEGGSGDRVREVTSGRGDTVSAWKWASVKNARS